MDELERQLAAVGVPSQREVNSHLGGAVEDIGIVAQENVDQVRRRQLFTPF